MTRTGSALTWGLLVAAALAPVARGQRAKPTLEAIAAAWKVRGEATQKVRARWKTKRTDGMGYMSDILPRRGRRMGVSPPRETTVTSESMLLLDGNNLRYHHEDSQYVVEFDRYCKEITEHLYTAEDYRELFPEGLGSGTWPQARVRRSGAYKGAGLTDIRPMLMAFRAHAGPLVSIQLSEYAVTGNSIVIAGATCYELMSGGAGQPAHSRLYIDPGKGHSVARQITYMNGKPYEQVTISHRYYPRIGWAPMSWDFVRYYGEKFSQSGKAEVTGLHAPASVDVEEFSLPFPPGSRVSDERTPEEYLIRHDGSKRRVLSSDIGATYEQMMATEPGAALPPTEPPAPRFPWVVAAAVLSGCLCLSLFIYRRMRSRTS